MHALVASQGSIHAPSPPHHPATLTHQPPALLVQVYDGGPAGTVPVAGGGTASYRNASELCNADWKTAFVSEWGDMIEAHGSESYCRAGQGAGAVAAPP